MSFFCCIRPSKEGSPPYSQQHTHFINPTHKTPLLRGVHPRSQLSPLAMKVDHIRQFITHENGVYLKFVAHSGTTSKRTLHSKFLFRLGPQDNPLSIKLVANAEKIAATVGDSSAIGGEMTLTFDEDKVSISCKLEVYTNEGHTWAACDEQKFTAKANPSLKTRPSLHYQLDLTKATNVVQTKCPPHYRFLTERICLTRS